MVSNSDVRKGGMSKSPVLDKGKFKINFPTAIVELESALHKFSVKKILYNTLFRGRGLEFESYRRFEFDDDANMIDWKASLRANSLLAKKYIQERDLSVYFLIDVSNSMLFGSGSKLKAEYAAEFAVSLGHLIISSGDRIGLVMFSDDVIKILHPANSKNQIALFMKYLSDPNFYGGGFNLNKAITHVLSVINFPYTVFFVVSDFIKTRKDSETSLRLMGSRFETIAVIIRDSLDESLPKTKYQFALQDPYSGRQMIMDPEIIAEKYKQSVIHHKEMLKEVFKKSRIDLLDLMIDKSFAHRTATFLKARATKGGRI